MRGLGSPEIGKASNEGVQDTKFIKFCLTGFGIKTRFVFAIGEPTFNFFGSDQIDSDRFPLL